MTAVQTSYSERMAPPGPGSLHGSDYDDSHGICETAAPGGIPFGRAVSQGTLSDKGVVIGGTLAAFRGCSTKDHTLGAEQDKYLPPNEVGIRHRGFVWVEPGHAVAANDDVYFSATTGVFSNQASGNLGPLKGARWETSCGTGGRALLQLAGYNKTA